MRCLSLAAASILLLAASAAHAGTITITYDFSASTITIPLGQVTIPPDGGILAASGVLKVPGSSISAPSAGAATIRSVALSATANKTLMQPLQVTLTGFLAAGQLASGMVNLTPSLSVAVISGTIPFGYSLTANCVGPPIVCNAVPTAATGSVGLTGPFNVGGLATPGSGMVSAMISISRSVTLLINLVGTEVSRTFDAPEPSPPVLELTALLSVLGAGWWHRRRAR
jgi:hypothetical protein